MAYVHRTISTPVDTPAPPEPISGGARHEIANWFRHLLFDAQLSVRLASDALRRTFLKPATITILNIPAEPDQQQPVKTGVGTGGTPLTPLP